MATILSARPLFVFIYALAVNLVFPAVLAERFSRGVVLVKIISISLIVGGLTLLALSG